MTFKVGDRVAYSFGEHGTVEGILHNRVNVRFDDSNQLGLVKPKHLHKLQGSWAETDSVNPAETFEHRVYNEVSKIADLLISKNRKYGDSALNPVRTFSKSDSVEQIKVRIDDKLSRIQRGQGDDEDTVTDLIGYLIMLKIAEAQ